MIITSFEQIKENMHVNTKRTVAVASAVEDKTLEAVMRAHDEGLVDYILTGPADEIIAVGGLRQHHGIGRRHRRRAPDLGRRSGSGTQRKR